MRVKKFTAPTVPEALALIKQEFGADAIILHQKHHPKPFWGLFGQAYAEVTAGLDESPTPRPQPQPASHKNPYERATRYGQDKVDLSFAPGNDIDRLKAMASTILEKRKRPPTSDEEKLSASPGPITPIKEPSAVPGLEASPPPLTAASFHDFPAPLIPETKSASAPPTGKPGTADSAGDERLARVEEQLAGLASMFETFMKRQEELGANPNQEWLDTLTSRGLTLQLARELVESVEPENHSEEAFREALVQNFPVKGPINLPEESERPKVVLLVGPTGVGKTTTLAKLAASYAYDLDTGEGPAQVVLVTADLYRLGAVEQIKEYAKILQIPLEQAYGPEEVSDCIQRHKEADLILVDTMGSSQRNEDQLGVLTSLAEQCKPCELHLVVSATTKCEDLADVMERFSRINPDALIVTKTDEATSLGSIYCTLQETPLPVSYITTGQMVPEDIEIAESQTLAELILPIAVEDTQATEAEATDSETEDGGTSSALDGDSPSDRGGPVQAGTEFDQGLPTQPLQSPETRSSAEDRETVSHA